MQDVVSEAQAQLAEWKEEALCLSNQLPQHDAVIQATLGVLKSFSGQLETLAKLQSPTLKQKHWRAVFEGQILNLLSNGFHSISSTIKKSIVSGRHGHGVCARQTRDCC